MVWVLCVSVGCALAFECVLVFRALCCCVGVGVAFCFVRLFCFRGV